MGVVAHGKATACRSVGHCDRFAAPLTGSVIAPVSMPTPAQAPGAASLRRRLAAILYDSVAVFGVCFAAGALALAVRRGNPVAPDSPWYTGYLLLVIYAYFAYSWRRGHTLGMRAWKLRVVDATTGARPSWKQTAIRFVVALLGWLPAGMGYWRCLWDGRRRTWHDAASHTQLRFEPLPPA